MNPESTNESLLVQLTSDDETRAEAAACSLAALGARALPGLEPLLYAKDSEHRWWAVRTLGQMEDPPTEWLVARLADETPEVRAAAALALSAHPAEGAASALVQALMDDDSIVAILAVNALVAIGKGAVPILLEAYSTLNQRGRIHAMRALAELRDHRAIPLMMKAIEGESSILRYWAEEGLERLGLDMVYIRPE